MCQDNSYITLIESPDAQITWCKACKTFSLAYQCGCSSFTEPELSQFLDVLKNLEQYDYVYQLMGEPHAIIKNPCSNAGFCLTETNVKRLVAYVSEALTVFQAFKVIYE